MNKLIISFLLIISACNSYESYKAQNGDATFKVLVMFQSWVENPENMIEDLSPVTLITNDVAFLNSLKHKEFLKYQKRNLKVKAVKHFWLSFFQNLNEDSVEKYALKFVYDKNYRTVKIYSSLDGAYTALSVSVVCANGISYLNLKPVQINNVARMGLSSHKIFRTYKFLGREIYLTKGKRDFGFYHIYVRHAPEWYLKNKLPLPPNTSLFLKSDFNYISDLIHRFTKSEIIYKGETYNQNYIIYESKVLCSVGTLRKYRLIIDKQTNNIITFHPINRVHKYYLGNEFNNYRALVYAK